MDETEVGKITHYFSKIGVAVVKASVAIKAGDNLHIKGTHADFTQKAESMQIDHKVVMEIKPGEEFGMKVSQEVKENDRVYKA